MPGERIFEILMVVALFKLFKLHAKHSLIKETQIKIQLYVSRSKIRSTDQQTPKEAEPHCHTGTQGGFCVGLETP